MKKGTLLLQQKNSLRFLTFYVRIICILRTAEDLSDLRTLSANIEATCHL